MLLAPAALFLQGGASRRVRERTPAEQRETIGARASATDPRERWPGGAPMKLDHLLIASPSGSLLCCGVTGPQPVGFNQLSHHDRR
jgi:hypothetical protein